MRLINPGATKVEKTVHVLIGVALAAIYTWSAPTLATSTALAWTLAIGGVGMGLGLCYRILGIVRNRAWLEGTILYSRAALRTYRCDLVTAADVWCHPMGAPSERVLYVEALDGQTGQIAAVRVRRTGFTSARLLSQETFEHLATLLSRNSTAPPERVSRVIDVLTSLARSSAAQI